jgi:GxxExxY protein
MLGVKTLNKRAGAVRAPAAAMTNAQIETLTKKIIACAIEVHRTLGPGLLESVYRQCMIIELTLEHLRVVSEQRIPLVYKGHRIGSPLKLDLLVNDCTS